MREVVMRHAELRVSERIPAGGVAHRTTFPKLSDPSVSLHGGGGHGATGSLGMEAIGMAGVLDSVVAEAADAEAETESRRGVEAEVGRSEAAETFAAPEGAPQAALGRRVYLHAKVALEWLIALVLLLVSLPLIAVL